MCVLTITATYVCASINIKSWIFFLEYCETRYNLSSIDQLKCYLTANVEKNADVF